MGANLGVVVDRRGIETRQEKTSPTVYAGRVQPLGNDEQRGTENAGEATHGRVAVVVARIVRANGGLGNVKVVADFKRFFFDREAVRKKLKRKRLKAVRRAAMTTRKIARRSLRRRKRISKPGETPSVHTSNSVVTLKNIQAGFDTSAESAIVGAVKVLSGEPGPPAPGVLEHGDRITRKNDRRTERVVGKAGEIAIDERRVETRDANGRFVKRDARSEGESTKTVVDFKGVPRRVTYAIIRTPEQARRANELNAELYGPDEISGTVEARPFMEPAIEVAAENFPELYLKEG